MLAMRLGSVLSATALLLFVSSSPSEAQQKTSKRAPSIRIYSTNGEAMVNTTTYIQPEISLSEDAYVFAVEMDLDGQIQVLHPDFPGLSVKINAHKNLDLPNFFVGFNQSTPSRGVYTSAGFLRYSAYDGYNDARGTVIALASHAPFDLDAISSGRDWNIVALRRLLENRSAQDAMNALADYLGAKGEPIGRDYMRFAGGASNGYAYGYGYGYDNYAYFSPCDLRYSFYGGLGFAQLAAIDRLQRARAAGQNPQIVGYDFCGIPIISFGPVVAGGFPQPRPRNPGDTTVFPKARFPGKGTPRHPAEASAEGVFPLPHRAGVGEMGDVTITAPTGRRAEPREFIQGYRPTPRTMSVPQGRMPIERTIPRSEPTAATGSPPVRDYHPEPRVEAPPPARVPDRTSTPAPVVHERPSTPPPPPPRAETPSKPPPSRQ